MFHLLLPTRQSEQSQSSQVAIVRPGGAGLHRSRASLQPFRALDLPACRLSPGRDHDLICGGSRHRFDSACIAAGSLAQYRKSPEGTCRLLLLIKLRLGDETMLQLAAWRHPFRLPDFIDASTNLFRLVHGDQNSLLDGVAETPI
ncbi:MAG: hypothetical protein ACT6U0_16055 [Shinella sp.]|uniref:hypothetical protein n=1 Tax=Shinella sp. TaxID=1870904 RepID=UPI0040364844